MIWCNVLFSGEADETWPEFVQLRRCRKAPTDDAVQTTASNRHDATSPSRASICSRSSVTLQARCSSRAAVRFSVNFATSSSPFGRRPQHQTSTSKLLEELDEMRRVGFFSCFIVDDNFIGNKKAAKALLRLIIPWQQKHGYPLAS